MLTGYTAKSLIPTIFTHSGVNSKLGFRLHRWLSTWCGFNQKARDLCLSLCKSSRYEVLWQHKQKKRFGKSKNSLERTSSPCGDCYRFKQAPVAQGPFLLCILHPTRHLMVDMLHIMHIHSLITSIRLFLLSILWN